MDYKDYTVKEFLHDKLFRKWVERPDNETNIFWGTWLRENPDQRETVEQARDILLMIGTEEYVPTEQDQAEVWSRINFSIHEAPIKRGLTWKRYAAIFTTVTVVAATTWFYVNREQVVTASYKTIYGQTEKIRLPDSTEIRLNANSALRFSMTKHGKREVWLDGEGFFTVVHDINNTPFLIHTSDVDVQVLATAFNVNTRRVMTRIVLNSGAVKLMLNGDDQQAVNMKPGEMITYSSKTKQLLRRNVNPADYSAWLDNTLVFNETPIEEVAAVLNDNLGIKLEIEDKDLQKELFTGSIPMSDVEIFFKTLSRSLHVVIEKKDNNNYSIRRKQTE